LPKYYEGKAKVAVAVVDTSPTVVATAPPAITK